MEYTNEEMAQVLDTGIALSKEKDRSRLLDRILDAGISISHCDAGTLYMCKGDRLYFKVMKTLSMNVDKGKNGEEIDLPPVPISPDNICAYTVIHREPLNIRDVYASQEFDFSGPKKYDRLTGYHTQSMLTIPLLNQEEQAVGVMQLINAMDQNGKVVAFSRKQEHILMSLASQAAIAVSNIRYMEEIKEQMWSFTEAMAEAIDTRTPYNANHVRNVALYVEKLTDYINELHEQGKETEYFSKNRKEQLVLSALLHDIGKISIPTKVMNKATRLGDRLEDIHKRFEMIGLKYQICYLTGKLSESEYRKSMEQLHEAGELTDQINGCGFLDPEKMESVERVLTYEYCSGEERIPFFTEPEKEALRIPRGTLTEQERKIMESHVELTERILSKVRFNSNYADVPKWAGQHHECLNGRGYPRGLRADELSVEARILAVADICDALLATDRPYKKPLPKEKAFAIMRDMADNGNIDGKLVSYMEQCI